MTGRVRRSLAALAVLVVVSGGAGCVWLTREVIYL